MSKSQQDATTEWTSLLDDSGQASRDEKMLNDFSFLTDYEKRKKDFIKQAQDTFLASLDLVDDLARTDRLLFYELYSQVLLNSKLFHELCDTKTSQQHQWHQSFADCLARYILRVAWPEIASVGGSETTQRQGKTMSKTEAVQRARKAAQTMVIGTGKFFEREPLSEEVFVAQNLAVLTERFCILADDRVTPGSYEPKSSEKVEVELSRGSLIEVKGKLYEVAGTSASEKGELKVAARPDPDLPIEKGALYDDFTPEELSREGTKIGAFGSVYPYSAYVEEKRALRVFFGTEIDIIPCPPLELIDTLKRAQEIGIASFEAHYLPKLTIHENDNYPGLKDKPTDLWKYWKRQDGTISQDALDLSGQWILIDNTPKPDSREAYEAKKYPHDPFTKTKIIGESRFNRSWNEIYKEINPKIAQALDVPPSMVRLPRAIEYNILGNLYYPEWGEEKAGELREWLNDKVRYFGPKYYLAASRKYHLGAFDPDMPKPDFAFRPMIVFKNESSSEKLLPMKLR